MNSYIALRKANRIRISLVSSASQEQIRDIVRYLQCTSWDLPGVEAVKSDLIDMAVRENQNGKELFDTFEKEAAFAAEMKKQCAPLNPQSFFLTVVAFGWFLLYGIEGVVMNFLIPNFDMEIEIRRIPGLAFINLCAYFCTKYVMTQVGFPLREHYGRIVGWTAIYTVIMYLVTSMLYRITPRIVFFRINYFWLGIFYLLLYTVVSMIRVHSYGKSTAAASRLY